MTEFMEPVATTLLRTGRDGADALTGNGGADSFGYNNISEGGDSIIDFSGVLGGELDRIDLSNIDAVNGDTTADFQITLLGTGLGLTGVDFVL